MIALYKKANFEQSKEKVTYFTHGSGVLLTFCACIEKNDRLYQPNLKQVKNVYVLLKY